VIAEVKNAESVPIKGLLKGTIENITFSKEVNLNANETKEITFRPEEFPQLVVKKPRLLVASYRWAHQNLYNLNLSFEIDGKVSDMHNLHFGIREISSWMNDLTRCAPKCFR